MHRALRGLALTTTLCLLGSACAVGVDGDVPVDEAGELASTSQALGVALHERAWIYYDGTSVQSAHSYNQGATTVRRESEGKYVVSLKEIGQNPYYYVNVQVSVVEKLGFSAALCTVNWVATVFDPDAFENLNVEVNCFDIHGQREDSAFYLSSFAYNSDAPPDETKEGVYAEVRNAREGVCKMTLQPGATGQCTRLGDGRYKVHFDGPTKLGGTVQLTADNYKPRYCNVQNWFPSGGGTDIYVNCFGPDGEPLESNFYIQYRLRAQENQGGFVWAHSPTNEDSYIPSATYNDRKPACFNTPEHDIAVRTAEQSNVDRYLVTYPEFGELVGPKLVHTTAYGSTSDFCRIAGPAFKPGDDPKSIRTTVHCYNDAGGRSKTKFTQLLDMNATPLCVL
jgi:hypothetical protein